MFMKGHFNVIAVSSEKERLETYGKMTDVRTFYLPMTRKITPFNDIKAVWKLYHFFKIEKPHLVHTHTPKAGTVGMFAAYLAKVPHRLHTVSGLPLMEIKGLKRIILNTVEKWTYRFATRVYPNSQGLYDYILDEKFASESKLKIIGNGSSNGIDTDSFSKEHFSEEELEDKKQELGISSLDFVFIFVGRIVKDKGINEMVAAFVMLQTKNSNCSLLLVGPYEDDLDPVTVETKAQISENQKIISIGYQNDVRIYFALSDALIFPSYREGFPNVVMQAGAMGLPCIVSDINGCNEIIEDNLNGIIVPVKDVEKLFEAMVLLLSDQALYQRLSLKSRSKIANRFEQMGLWKVLLTEYQCL